MSVESGVWRVELRITKKLYCVADRPQLRFGATSLADRQTSLPKATSLRLLPKLHCIARPTPHALRALYATPGPPNNLMIIWGIVALYACFASVIYPSDVICRIAA